MPIARTLLSLLALALLLQSETLWRPMRHDAANWLYMAQRQSHGEMPGRDLWDNKLPPIYLIARAAILSGHPQLFLWLLRALATAAAALAVAALVRTHHGSDGPARAQHPAPTRDVAPASRHSVPASRDVAPSHGSASSARIHAPASHDSPPASPDSASASAAFAPAQDKLAPAVAALLLILAAAHPSYHSGGFSTEIFAMPLSAIAVWAGWRATRNATCRTTLLWSLAGLAWTLATALRPPLALAAVVVTLIAAAYATGDTGHSAAQPTPETPQGRGLARSRRYAASLLQHLPGVAAALLLIFAHPLAHGYLQECVAAAIQWPLQIGAAHARGPLASTTPERLIDVLQDIAKIGWLHAGALAGLIMSLRRRRRLAPLLGAWYLAALFSTAAGWANFAHYHYATFAPAAALCGMLVAELPRPHKHRIAAALLLITAAAAISLNFKEFTRAGAFAADRDKRALRVWLEENAPPDETLFFWVGGRNADLVYRANRPAGQRHFMAYSYFDMDMALFAEFARDFEANPPARVVQCANIDAPRLAGADKFAWEANYPALLHLKRFIAEHYAAEAQIGAYTILRRHAPESRPARAGF